MNIKNTIAIAALLTLSGSVFANDLMPFSELDNFKSSKTRAEVKAEIVQQAAIDHKALVRGDLTAIDQATAGGAIVRNKATAQTETIESAKNLKGSASQHSGS